MSAILVVDDEHDLVSLLDFNLRQAGFETLLATSGQEAQQQLRRRIPDLVLLDLMMPDIPGATICRSVKSDPRTRHVPVIMLTAKSDELDRVVGFELGADDYVTKPFSVRELVLRVRAILRRAGTAASTTQEPVGLLRVDVDAHRAFVGNDEVELTALEFRLLATLMSRAGRVQSREQLLMDVWEVSSDVETRTVDTHVKRLREKLGLARDQLETVRGIGYRLVEPGKILS